MKEHSWRVEAACREAWPSSRETLLDGWVLRAAGGPTRRANSASPLHAGAMASAALIDRVEAHYRERGQQAIFRIPGILSEEALAIDALLDARGYRREAPTRTLVETLATIDPLPDDRPVRLEALPDEAWLDARDRLSASMAEASRSYREIIAAIAHPCSFAAVIDDGRIASLAFAVLQGDLIILESVMTDPARRGRGLARSCVNALMGWGRERGAASVALQVTADNVAAIALYESLGIGHDLYGYHYRIAAPIERA